MARIASLSVLTTPTGNDYLAEQYGAVVANVQKNGIAQQIKNTNLSGTPTAGTVEAKRFQNRTSNSYGTARSGAAGQKVTAVPVTIAINTNKELICEVEEKDVALYGVDDFIGKQAAIDEKSMQRELERAFWTEANTAGSSVTLSGTTAVEKAEEMIQALETQSDNFVDGVERDMINLVLVPSEFGKLRTYMDSVNDGTAGQAAVGMFHGVKVYSSVYLPSAVTYGIAIADGAIAQPVLPTVAPAQKIPLSNAYAFGLFYSYGTKAVAADMIFKA